MPAAPRRPPLVRRTAALVLALACACSEAPGGAPHGGATGGASQAGGAGGAGPSTGGSAAGLSGAGGSASAGASGSSAANGGTTAGGSATGGSTSGGTGSGGSGNGGAGTAGSSSPDAGSSGTSVSGGAGPGGNGGSAGGVAAGGASGAAGTSGSGGEPPSTPPNILVFSHTAGFRHDSIPNGIAALTLLADERDWTLTATEDPTLFNDGALAPYDVIVFLSSSGDVFDAEQQAAFERFIRTPSPRKGFVGIHAASTTEYDWPFFGELVGAFFREHPEGTAPATIVVEDATHPSTASLPARWTRTDEWYAFRTNPRANVTVLLSLDETTYAAGTAHMDGDHPIAWFHTNVGARAFYTALGHTAESYTEPLFLDHVATAIEWAAGR